MDSIRELSDKVKDTLKEEGLGMVFKKTFSYVTTYRKRKLEETQNVYCDVLFINGCDESVPHPIRYRVTHQREQLETRNVSTRQVYYINLQLDMVRFARTFVFFRCPYTDMVGEFIKLAHKMNKKVLFDIDDLVIDTKYTDTIKYLDSMSPEDRAVYDDGVNRMGKTLCLCDAAVTTTERLAAELSNYVPEVYINRNTASEKMYELSLRALRDKAEKPEKDTVDIGYFSGSITHNDDFRLILPSLVSVMDEIPETRLHVVGELELPEELERFAGRVVAHPFTDWKKLPEMISEVDINLAPLEDSIFNEAKSENKWVEAALVKVPTIASDLGAFKEMMEDGKTGFLCSTEEEWTEKLKALASDKGLREKIGKAAYAYCVEHCITMNTGDGLKNFIRKYTTPNIGFFFPALNISGGIMVAMKHTTMLQDEGYDVTLFNVDRSVTWCYFEDHQFPVVSKEDDEIAGRIDQAVATMWVTTHFLEEYRNIGRRYYLVQNFETDFYKGGSPLRPLANRSYCPHQPTQFLTISRWCQDWLKERYSKDARYAPNGIDTARFAPHKRSFAGKIRVLVEGDCGVDYKNVDESFRLTNQLNPEQFEIWYLSYNATPKDWYRVDRFFNKIPYEKVADIYAKCDILIKTSLLESFSYPPLEMMATGGLCVVVPNGGNVEYLRDGENCLMYEAGELEKGLECIKRICEDPELRDRLYEGGIATANSRDWKEIGDDIVAMYREEEE